MKILTITNLYPPHYLGGYELVCELVCRALLGRGHDVRVLTSRHGLKGAPPPREPRVMRRMSLYPPFGHPPGGAPLRRLSTGLDNHRVTADVLARFRPDVAFIWSQLRLTLGPVRAVQDAGVRAVFSFNDEHIAAYRAAPFRPTPRGLLRFAADRGPLRWHTLDGIDLSRTTCISRSLRDSLVARGLLSASRVIYQGIDVSLFPLKDTPGSKGSQLRLLYVGQLHPYKGVHTLIEAAHLLGSRTGQPVRVSIAGEGPAGYRSRLARLAAKGPARVLFLGKIPYARIPGVYRAHDIFVFPSVWREPFGLTHLEAMASGTPVVSTTRGGQGEMLVEGVNALTFRPGDAAGLWRQVARLSQDGALRERLARQGRRTVVECFSVDRYADEVEALLAEAAGAPRAPGGRAAGIAGGR